MTSTEELRSLLAEAARLVGEAEVLLRVDTAILETVYVGVEDGRVVAHDRGATFFYLAAQGPRSGDATYTEWSAEAARSTLDGTDVELAGEATDDEAGFRIELTVAESDDLAVAVERVSQAIEAVFDAHLRADLRGSWESE
jgi:hypothetical protein